MSSGTAEVQQQQQQQQQEQQAQQEGAAGGAATSAANPASPAPPQSSPYALDSIFQGDPTAPVYDVPVSVIHRPIPSVLDPAKVEDFACKLQGGTKLTPIEVVWVEHEGQNYYFAFGGCHRWAAHKQLGSATIPARLIKMAASDISLYLGASSPFRKK